MKRMTRLKVGAVLGIAAGFGMFLLVYFLAGEGLHPNDSKGDAFCMLMMVCSGLYAIIVPTYEYIDARIVQAQERAAYKAGIKNDFALFNKDYWSEHNLDGLPRIKMEVKRLGIDKELPTALDCRLYLYGYDPYEKNPPPEMPRLNSSNTAIEVDGEWHSIPEKYRGMPIDVPHVQRIMEEIRNKEVTP